MGHRMPSFGGRGQREGLEHSIARGLALELPPEEVLETTARVCAGLGRKRDAQRLRRAQSGRAAGHTVSDAMRRAGFSKEFSDLLDAPRGADGALAKAAEAHSQHLHRLAWRKGQIFHGLYMAAQPLALTLALILGGLPWLIEHVEVFASVVAGVGGAQQHAALLASAHALGATAWITAALFALVAVAALAPGQTLAGWVPLLRAVVSRNSAARVGEELARLFEAGVPTGRALRSAGTRHTRRARERMADRVDAGVPLHEALSDGPSWARLLAPATRRADALLGAALSLTARRLHDDAARRFGALLSGVSVALLLLNAGLLGWVAYLGFRFLGGLPAALLMGGP